MAEKSLLRSLAGKLRRRTVRSLLRQARNMSHPHDFVAAVNETLRAESLRDYLVSVGADSLVHNLTEMARHDEKLRDHLVKETAEGLFHTLYPMALADAALREHMTARGIDDLERHIVGMASVLGTPLAQRAGGYGQEGEDLILSRLLDGKTDGFYVDVGAHHPFRFSNTYLLYQRGWHGINIDAMPGSMAAFNRWRPHDINIECVVSSDTTPHRYFQFEEPALNTVSEEIARMRQVESPQYRFLGEVTLQARPLAAILTEHVPPGQAIDILNVDVEGHDLDVLASNDWDRFRPRLIVAEMLSTGFSEMEGTALYRFLAARGYRLFSKMYNSAIFS